MLKNKRRPVVGESPALYVYLKKPISGSESNHRRSCFIYENANELWYFLEVEGKRQWRKYVIKGEKNIYI